MIRIEYIVEAAVLLISGGFTTYLFHVTNQRFETKVREALTEIHQHIESVDAKLLEELTSTRTVVCKAVSLGVEDVNAAGLSAKEELKSKIYERAENIKQHVEEQSKELKQNAYALKVHAQQMHDESQARSGSRIVPTRGR